jgi:ATP-binding cassette subfamily B protein
VSGETEKSLSSDDSLDVVRRVIRENWRVHFRQYWLAFFLLLLVAAGTAFPAWIVRDIVNDVFVKQDIFASYLIAGAVFAAFTIRGFATYGYMYVLGKIANSIVARYQRRVFAHLLNLGVPFHKTSRSAYLVGQINQNIAGMRTMMNNIITVFARDLITLIALVAVMVIQDPYMSLISVTVLPVIALVMSRYVRKIRKVARQEVDLNSLVTSAIVESSQGIEIVKAFTMEPQMKAKMLDLTQRVEGHSNRIVQLNAKAKMPTEVLAGFAIAGVIAFGGYRVAELGHDIGALLSFLTAAMLAYEPARKLAAFRVQFEKNIVNARMLFELLDLKSLQQDRDGSKELVVDKGEIHFDGVEFEYLKDEPTISGASFVAKAGKTTALVGPSGGGKSTLLALLQRFFDVNAGSISVDGQDIATVTAESLRKSIAYVSQQPILFEGSILENIRLGRPDASDEEVYASAKRAQAHEFILEQPEGYATAVGEMGGNLSGGQRQRLSIARAFLRDTPILLLDEATSALDNQSELKVQEALETLVTGRTTLVIAHRLSTVRKADRIYVIEDGKVSQEGTHAQLLKKKSGTYAKLHALGMDSDELKGLL